MIVTVSLQRQLLRRRFMLPRRALHGAQPLISRRSTRKLFATYQKLAKKIVNRHFDTQINLYIQKKREQEKKHKEQQEKLNAPAAVKAVTEKTVFVQKTVSQPAQVKETKQPKKPFSFPPISPQPDIVKNPAPAFQTKKTEKKPGLTSAKTPKKALRKNRLVNTLFMFFMSASLALLVMLFAPVAYYRFVATDPIPITADENGTPLGGDFNKGTKASNKIPEPKYDATLPEGEWLIIPRIGVRTEIQENQKSEEALIKGVWRVPEFGKPGDQALPIILAAHRYGYNWWWKGEYWRYNSFYNLPKLEPGDTVEVISNKRKYVYEIYAGEEGKEITDYNADMILYTCKFLTSPVRHFRYARLIDQTKNTQSTQQAAR